MIEFSDVVQLVALYAGFATTVFCVGYGALALYSFFKSFTSPGWKHD